MTRRITVGIKQLGEHDIMTPEALAKLAGQRPRLTLAGQRYTATVVKAQVEDGWVTASLSVPDEAAAFLLDPVMSDMYSVSVASNVPELAEGRLPSELLTAVPVAAVPAVKLCPHCLKPAKMLPNGVHAKCETPDCSMGMWAVGR